MKSFDKNKNHRQDKIKQHSMSYGTFLSILNSLWYLNEIEHGISLNRNVSYRMFHFILIRSAFLLLFFCQSYWFCFSLYILLVILLVTCLWKTKQNRTTKVIHLFFVFYIMIFLSYSVRILILAPLVLHRWYWIGPTGEIILTCCIN